MGRLLGTLLGAFCLCAGSVAAQEGPGTVRFLTDDGAVLVSGTLIGHDGRFARVNTPDGPVTLAITGLRCDGAGCPPPGPPVAQLRIAGAPEMARVLMPALIARFAASSGYATQARTPENGALRFDLSRAENALSITILPTAEEQALAGQDQGAVDLVMALRRHPDMDPRRVRVVALDALVPAVARDTPLDRLTLGQLRGMLSGTLTDWSELGLPDDGAIRVLAAASPAQTTLLAAVPPHPLPDAQTDETLARLRGGIALLRASSVRMARPVALAGPCGRPVTASAQHLKAGEYPLAAPLMLILPAGRMSPAIPAFLEFLGTTAAQRVVRRSGFTDLEPLHIPLAAQGQRLANAVSAADGSGGARLRDLQDLIATLDGADRLTLAFRFEGGGTDLDAGSLGNVQRLARMIAGGRFHGKTVLLLGFSDGTGPADANRALSRERADVVHAAVQDALAGLSATTPDTALEADGHGEALPIACDDTPWGRRINRRVEVWLR